MRLAALLAGLCVAACSPHDSGGSLRVEDAWSRPTAPGMSMGVAYFTLVNDTGVDDVLLSASTPVAARVEMHETAIEDGMARMRPLAEIRVPARSRVDVAPGGIHLMLVELTQPLPAGSRAPLTLEFRNAGKIAVDLAVQER